MHLTKILIEWAFMGTPQLLPRFMKTRKSVKRTKLQRHVLLDPRISACGGNCLCLSSTFLKINLFYGQLDTENPHNQKNAVYQLC